LLFFYRVSQESQAVLLDFFSSLPSDFPPQWRNPSADPAAGGSSSPLNDACPILEFLSPRVPTELFSPNPQVSLGLERTAIVISGRDRHRVLAPTPFCRFPPPITFFSHPIFSPCLLSLPIKNKVLLVLTLNPNLGFYPTFSSPVSRPYETLLSTSGSGGHGSISCFFAPIGSATPSLTFIIAI